MSILEGLQKVLAKIAAAEARAGRPAGSVELVAVSKTKTADVVRQVVQAGIKNIGENYVQEALKKKEKLKTEAAQPQWHLIGSIQTNKSKLVVGQFDLIHSVDRLELAKALNKRAQEAGIVQKILVQVKLGDEPSKAGVPIGALDDLLRKILVLKNLSIEGMMALPPVETEPENARKYFAQLRELKKQYASLIPSDRGSFQHLSMGTTHDYEVAIEEGATLVRVGTAIFGPREGKAVAP